MSTRWTSLLAGLAGVSLLSIASGASALSLDSGNSGLDQAVGCSDALCFSPFYDTLTSSGLVTGELGISGSTLSFDIQLASATIESSLVAGPIAPSITFDSVVYSGSVAVSLDGSNNYVVDGAQTATVSGSVTPSATGLPAALSGSMVLVTGLCSGAPGSDLQCGLIFGPQLDFSADLGGETVYFQHTIDAFAVIPEPGTALLLGTGLIGLAIRRER